MPAKPGRRARFRPQLDQLEDRSVPTASLNAFASQATLHVAPILPTGVPSTLAKVIVIANKEAASLNTAVRSLERAMAHVSKGSLSSGLLAQSLQVSKNELSAMNKEISHLKATHPSAAQAYLQVFALEIGIANTNTALQNAQLMEAIHGHITKLHLPKYF